MKFGLCLFNWDPFSYAPRLYEELAVEAENLGYDAVFVTDHFMRPHSTAEITPKQHSTIEAWTLLAYLAAKTRRIRLGTCVTPIPLRPPQILAKMVATVDVLSEGRVILGAGAGWGREEFEAYGKWRDNRQRVMMTREGIQLIRRLWTEDVVDFEGTFFKVKGAVLEPKPIQKNGPPIWFGALRDEMLKLTAELADGWIPGRGVGATVEYYQENAKKLRGYLNSTGRDKKLTFALMGYFVEEGVSSTLPAIGSMAKAPEYVQKYKEGGCEYLAVTFFPLSKFKDMMRRFSREIIPSFT